MSLLRGLEKADNNWCVNTHFETDYFASPPIFNFSKGTDIGISFLSIYKLGTKAMHDEGSLFTEREMGKE